MDSYDEDLIGTAGAYSVAVTEATTCSAAYSPNVSTDALSLILDFVQGTVSVNK